MKIITLLFFALISNCLFAGFIDTELMKDLDQIKSNDMIEVIINLNYQKNIDFTHVINRKGKLNLVRKNSQISRKSIETFFKTSKKGVIEKYDYFWIFNGFVLKATKDFIIQISKRNDVYSIEKSNNFKIIEPEKSNADHINREPGWNLEIMNIPEIWDLGFCGEGQTIGVMDSGINPEHPALIDSWSGLWFDATEEFSDPIDILGHGTVVSGMIVGGDGNGPFEFDTGVAPKAEFAMVSISHSGFIYDQHIFAGFQWFTSLIEEGNDIRILSCAFACDLQSQSLWRTIQVLRQLDFIPVFAVGNGGTIIPVMCPASYPTVIGVGATDSNDEIWPGSCHGPAPDNFPWNEPSFWETIEWNLIKPDVCTPGADVQTTTMDGGYVIQSGTSLATPTLSGIIALMLQKNPSLQYNQIYNILLDTAVPLGETSPNNIFGRGRIDALAAIEEVPIMENEYLIINGHNFDGILNPGNVVGLVIGIKSYMYDVQNVIVTISCDNPLIQIDNDSISFGDILSDSTVYNLNNPFLIDIGESCLQGNPETLYIQITTSSGSLFSDEIDFILGDPELTTIFFDDFENGSGNWIYDDNWQICPDIFYSPVNSMKNQFVEHPDPPSQLIEILKLSEPFDLSSCISKAEINFLINYEFISYSSWLYLDLTTNPDDPYAFRRFFSVSANPNNNEDFEYINLDISEFSGEENVFLQFSVKYHQEEQWFVAIDDFEIKADQLNTSSDCEYIIVNDFGLKNHPNPFNPETTISYSISEESNVELSVYNIKGQKVRTLVNNIIERGNHSIIWKGINDSGNSVATGVYFYKLSVNNKIKAVKKCLMLK